MALQTKVMPFLCINMLWNIFKTREKWAHSENLQTNEYTVRCIILIIVRRNPV